MDPYSFLRSLDERPPFLNGLDGLNLLRSSLSGLNADISAPVDVRGQGRVAREEAALQAILVQKITEGDWDSLQPNSGRAVNIDDHHICVAYHEEPDSGCRVWEWHGHLLIFDEDNGFSPEYTYGNFFQPLEAGRSDIFSSSNGDERKRRSVDLGMLGVGLGGIIDGDDVQMLGNKKQNGRILHRFMKRNSGELSRK